MGGSVGDAVSEVGRAAANPIASQANTIGNAVGAGNVGSKYLDPLHTGDRTAAAAGAAVTGGDVVKAFINPNANNPNAPQFQVDNTADNQKMLDQIAISKNARDQDMAEGDAAGAKTFAPGSLGRVDANRSPETAAIIAARQAQSQGFTPQQRQLMREEGISNVMSNNAGQERQFRAQMASQGIRGPAAAAALARMKMGTQSQLADQERQTQLANITQSNTGLDNLEKSTGAAQAQELGKQQFNIGQQNKETFGQQATKFGYASLGAGDRASALQRIVGDNMANASASQAYSSGGKK